MKRFALEYRETMWIEQQEIRKERSMRRDLETSSGTSTNERERQHPLKSVTFKPNKRDQIP